LPPHILCAVCIWVESAALRRRYFRVCHPHAADVAGGLRLQVAVAADAVWARCGGVTPSGSRALHTKEQQDSHITAGQCTGTAFGRGWQVTMLAGKLAGGTSW
jgi:hypothetical protein